jgi:PAS domain S-box-containing protein
LVAFLFFAGTLAGGSRLALYEIEAQQKASAADALRAVLNTSDKAVRVWAAGERAATTMWARNPEVRAAAEELLAARSKNQPLRSHPAQEKLRKLLGLVIDESDYQGFFLIAPDGHNLASSRDANTDMPNLLLEQKRFFADIWAGLSAISLPQPSDVPLSAIARPAPENRSSIFTRSPQLWDMQIPADADARPAQPSTMFAGAPVRDSNGNIIATFTFRLNPYGRLLSVLRQGRFGESGETYVVDSKGSFLTESRYEDQLREMGLLAGDLGSAHNVRACLPATGNEPCTYTYAMAQLLERKNGLSTEAYLDYRGVPVIGAWRWDEQFGFGMITEIDQAEAFASFTATRNIVLFLLAFNIFLFMVIGAALVAIARERVARVSAALASSENRLQAVLNSVMDGIITIDPKGIIRSFNPAAERLFGYAANEAIGKNVAQLMTDEDAATHDGHLKHLTRTGKRRFIGISRDLKGRRKDGSLRDINISITEIYQDRHQVFVGVCRDVTEQRKAEAELEQHRVNLEFLLEERTVEIRRAMATLESEVLDRQRAESVAQVANRTKSEFLANMSHELRTPLNAILGFAEIIEGRMLGSGHDEKYEEYAGDIRDSGEHLLEIINDILDLSKIEAGEMKLDEGVVGPAALVGSCVRLTRERADAAGLSMNISSDLPSFVLHGDERKLKQVLINLISNAIKFTERGGKIDVSTLLNDDGDLLLIVEDNGIGIAAEDMDKILSPFGQVDGSLARQNQGTGLGLPLVKSLVELHGGSLHIDSQPGKGTRVTVQLPARLIEPIATRSTG